MKIAFKGNAPIDDGCSSTENVRDEDRILEYNEKYIRR